MTFMGMPGSGARSGRIQYVGMGHGQPQPVQAWMLVRFSDVQRIPIHVLANDKQRVDMAANVESPSLADGEEVGSGVGADFFGVLVRESGGGPGVRPR